MGDINYAPLIQSMEWSYSRVKSFHDCPYRWYLRYIAMPRAKKVDMFFSNYGKFVHEILADFYLGKITAKEAYVKYIKDFKSAVKVYYPYGNTYSQYYRDGKAYMESLCMPDSEIIGVEEEAKFTIDGIPFIGFLDRIDRDPETGKISIVDHKSRKLKQRSNRKKPTKTDIELDEYCRQLYIYSTYIKDKYGEFPEKICFNCFRSGEMIEEIFDINKYNEAVEWAVKSVREIEKTNDFKPEIDWFKCNNLCEMNEYCEYFSINKG